MSPVSSSVLSFEDARHAVEAQAAKAIPVGKESLELLDSFGRILAEPIFADRNFPPFRRAARDGYAVIADDLAKLPSTLQVVGEIRAGEKPESLPSIKSGQAATIMTGAPAPAGADAVVMVEYTSQQGGRVVINKGISAGDNIVPIGSEAKRGEQLLTAGMRLDHAAIAIAASVGKTHVLVHEKPKVAVLSTGDEIVDIDVQPGPTQIRNSNSYSLAAQIQAAGGESLILPIAPDETGRLRELINDGLEADLLLLAGGVSMGKYDLVEQVLTEVDAKFFFTGAKIQPGKPVVFGCVDNKYFFGLPGNPVSTMVTFELFVRPMIEALSGASPQKLKFLHAKLKSEVKVKTGLKRFLPAYL
ncbi:MAG TPA: gephyrin-like molybdotransferase Glp, partial [Terriglobales bacterium]|nr:gephyrin-like molybdotransferase Glp [Terriglobales bacterium]